MARFHARSDKQVLISKVLKKYRSKEYRDKWYHRGIEPPESLLFFLNEYAKEYGKEVSGEELREFYEKHNSSFSVSLYRIEGYYIELLQGQGSAIRVFEIPL